jgi:hypothetical protein
MLKFMGKKHVFNPPHIYDIMQDANNFQNPNIVFINNSWAFMKEVSGPKSKVILEHSIFSTIAMIMAMNETTIDFGKIPM